MAMVTSCTRQTKRSSRATTSRCRVGPRLPRSAPAFCCGKPELDRTWGQIGQTSEWEGEEGRKVGRKAETKMENGSRGQGKKKKGAQGGVAMEKVNTVKRRQKTARKAEPE